MSEFDLVPSEYRKTIQLKTNIKRFLLVYILVVVVIVAAKIMLDDKVRAVENRVQQQQSDKQIMLAEQQRYNELHQNITVLERRVEILSSLRGGPPVISIFEMLDRVLGKNIWIDSWEFARAGEWAEPEPESVNRGYLIVIPDGGQQKEQAWRLNAHMTLSGQAIDHSNLAEFVQALLHQPEIEDVKVQKTGLRQYTSTSVVDFSLAIIINSQFRVTP